MAPSAFNLVLVAGLTLVAGSPAENCTSQEHDASTSNSLMQGSFNVQQILKSDLAPAPKDHLVLLSLISEHSFELTPQTQDELGWTLGITVEDSQYQFLDHAKTYSKDNHCIVGFSATNDVLDKQQILGGLGTHVEFCGFQVHAGVVDEMVGFMKASNWNDLIAALHAETCTTVTAIGHSFGGSLATLFAACANNGHPGFGTRTDFGLVTFAPFAISRTPMTSRGGAFVGTRYSITGTDGGNNPHIALPRGTKTFRLTLLRLYAQLAQALAPTLTDQLAGLVIMFENGDEASALRTWPHVEQQLLPLMVPTFGLASAPPKGMEPMQRAIMQAVMEAYRSGDIVFAHDPISNLGAAFGLRHALMDFQPLNNPVKAPGLTPFEKVLATSGVGVADLPRGDAFQNLFGVLAYQGPGGFPNHNSCCYLSEASVAGCQTKFTSMYDVSCSPSPLR